MRHSLQVMASSRPTSTSIQPPASEKDQPAPTISLSDAPKIALPKNLAQTLQFLSDDDLETLRVSVDSELERLSKVILFGERSLRRALSDYVDHFHGERNHQGKGNVLLFPRATDRQREGPVRCRERLGGLLRYYHREAA